MAFYIDPRLGLKRKPLALIKKLRKAKKEAPAMEKPAVVKTHLRDMIVVPEMIGSVVGIHQGKTFNQVEIKVRHVCRLSAFMRCAVLSCCSLKWLDITWESLLSHTSL